MSQTSQYSSRKRTRTRQITVEDNFVDSQYARNKQQHTTPQFVKFVDEKNFVDSKLDEAAGVQCRLQRLILIKKENEMLAEKAAARSTGSIGGGSKGKPSAASTASPSSSSYVSSDSFGAQFDLLANPLTAMARFSTDDVQSKEVWYKAPAASNGQAEGPPLGTLLSEETEEEEQEVSSANGAGPESSTRDEASKTTRSTTITLKKRVFGLRKGIGQVGPLFSPIPSSQMESGDGAMGSSSPSPSVAALQTANPFDPRCEGIRIPIFGNGVELTTVAAILQTKLQLGFSPLSGNSCMPAQVVAMSSPECLGAYEASLLVTFNEDGSGGRGVGAQHAKKAAKHQQKQQQEENRDGKVVLGGDAAKKKTPSDAPTTPPLLAVGKFDPRTAFADNRSIQSCIAALRELQDAVFLYVGGGKNVLIGQPQIVRFAEVVTEEEERTAVTRSDDAVKALAPPAPAATAEGAVAATETTSSLEGARAPAVGESGSIATVAALPASSSTSTTTVTTFDTTITPLLSSLVLPDIEHTMILRGVSSSIGQVHDRMRLLGKYGFVNYIDTTVHGKPMKQLFNQAHRIIHREFDPFLRAHLAGLCAGFKPLIEELSEALTALDTDFNNTASGGSLSGVTNDGKYIRNLSHDASSRRAFNPWLHIESKVSPQLNEVLGWMAGEMKHLGLNPSHPKMLLEIIQIAAGSAEKDRKKFSSNPHSGHNRNSTNAQGHRRALDPASLIKETIHRHALLDTVKTMSDVHWNSYASLRLKVLGPQVAVGDIVIAKDFSGSGSGSSSSSVIPTNYDVHGGGVSGAAGGSALCADMGLIAPYMYQSAFGGSSSASPFDIRLDMGAADVPRDGLPSHAHDHHSPRWAHAMGSPQSLVADPFASLVSSSSPSSPLLPRPIASIADYNAALFDRGILKVVTSQREAAHYTMNDVVLPKIGRGGSSGERNNGNGGGISAAASEAPAALLSATSGMVFPQNKLGAGTFDELAERLKVNHLGLLKMAPWGTYRRLVEKPLPLPSSSPSTSANNASSLQYAIWNDARGIVDDSNGLMESLLVTDKEDIRRLRNPLTSADPQVIRKSVRGEERRDQLLSGCRDKMSVLVKCRLRRGVPIQSLLREPFTPRYLNAERLWALGLGEEAAMGGNKKKGNGGGERRNVKSAFKQMLRGAGRR